MRIGRKIIRVESATSTNDIAKEFGVEGEPEGLVITALEQTKGRGRRGRGWVSQRGKSVIFSALLRPAWRDSEASWLGILAGIATAQTVADFGVTEVSIKWPNDVLVRGRKIAGALVEPRVASNVIEFAVIGIGVNVLQVSDDWPDDLKERTTSLMAEGVSTTIEAVTQKLIERLDAAYRTPTDELMQQWTSWSHSSELPVLD